MAPLGSPWPHYWGAVASLLLLLAAGWLILAPYAVAGQPYGGGWSPATGNDVWCGALLALVALARLGLHGTALLGGLRAEQRRGTRPAATAEAVLLLLTAQLPVLIALWLIASPWIMQTQAAGAPWAPGTVDNLVVGLLVLGAALGSAAAALVFAEPPLAGARA